MKWAGVVLVLVGGLVILLIMASSLPGNLKGNANRTPGPDGSGDPVYVQHDATKQGVTALYAKVVSEKTPSIIVDLYSGDSGDPLSLTVITPDKTLGPFNDMSDGVADGRIYLKISRNGGLKPGTWKFRVQSSRDIAVFNWSPKTGNLPGTP
jgi:hypothetical protein